MVKVVNIINTQLNYSAWSSELQVQDGNSSEIISIQFDVPVGEEVKLQEFPSIEGLKNYINVSSWVEVVLVDHIKLEGISFTSIGYKVHKPSGAPEQRNISVIGHVNVSLHSIHKLDTLLNMAPGGYAEEKSNNYLVNERLLRKFTDENGTKKRVLKFVNSISNAKSSVVLYITIKDQDDSIYITASIRKLGDGSSVTTKKKVIKYSDLEDGVLYDLIECINRFDGFEPQSIQIFVFESRLMFVNLTV